MDITKLWFVFRPPCTTPARPPAQAGKPPATRSVTGRNANRWSYEAERHDAETEINRLLPDADQKAHEMIQSQKSNTEKLAQALLEQETLAHGEVLALLGLGEMGIAQSATTSMG